MAVASFVTKASNTTDAFFRDWGSKLSAAIQSVGLINTTDTGQINWTTVLTPSSTGQFSGYEIYRFNDSLHATVPVYIRIEYGSSINSQIACGLKITVGKSTDGAGVIGGILHDALANNCFDGSSTSDTTCYVSSGDGSMLVFSLFQNDSYIQPITMRFALERSRDGAGNPTSVGTFVHRVSGIGSEGQLSEASDYTTELTNTQNRMAIYTGYEIGVSTVLNDITTGTPMFKAECINLSRVKWNPRCFYAYAESDAGSNQTISINSNNYKTLGSINGGYGDCAKQQYCCLAMAFF